MILKRDEPLAPRTSYRIGGKAEYFFIPERMEEVSQAMSYCRAKGIDLRVLGGGTNVLVGDEGCRAVLSLERFKHTDCFGPFAKAEAGASFPAFVKKLADNSCQGAEALCGIPGMRCVLPHAAFYAMPMLTLPPGRTDEHYILSLLRETGILCVYGSGFGMPPEAGSFRIVYLAPPDELRSIYADIAAFTRQYLQRA
jgi:hypothetical protein